jgi:hypothetical protein
MGRIEQGTDKAVRNYFRREFDIDIKLEYERLKDVGRIPTDKLKDRHALVIALNECGRNAVRARIIASQARRMRELFNIRYHREMREINRAATRQIQEWMDDKGIKKKQITNGMILEEIASTPMYAKRYAALLAEREELKSIREVLKEFAQQWSERKGTIQSQLGALRMEKEVILGGRQ